MQSSKVIINKLYARNCFWQHQGVSKQFSKLLFNKLYVANGQLLFNPEQ